MRKYVDYEGKRYFYEYRLAKDGETCLGTTDPDLYCNGVYAYSRKDPGNGLAFVVTEIVNLIMTAEELLKERDDLDKKIQEARALEGKGKRCYACNGTGLSSIEDQAYHLWPRKSMSDAIKRREYIEKHKGEMIMTPQEFAAQEVEAYKERLRIAFNEFYEESEKGRMTPGYHAGFVEARHIIDTVK